MARRSEHSQEQIKEMALSAAEDIIHRQGVEALTVRKVALDIGYTVGSIYMVFANMQDLVLHIKGRVLDQLDLQLRDTSAGEGAEQQIFCFADRYLNFAAANFNRWSLTFAPVFRNNEDLPDWYRQKVEQMFARLETLFRQLSPESSAEQAQLAARALLCGMHGICSFSLTGQVERNGMEEAEPAVHLLADNFIQGWKNR